MSKLTFVDKEDVEGGLVLCDEILTSHLVVVRNRTYGQRVEDRLDPHVLYLCCHNNSKSEQLILRLPQTSPSFSSIG